MRYKVATETTSKARFVGNNSVFGLLDKQNMTCHLSSRLLRTLTSVLLCFQKTFTGCQIRYLIISFVIHNCKLIIFTGFNSLSVALFVRHLEIGEEL